MKEAVSSLGPCLPPQAPIKPVPHNGGGEGEQSSRREPALHQSMCLFKQEASSLELEGLFLCLVTLGVSCYQTRDMQRKGSGLRAENLFH